MFIYAIIYVLFTSWAWRWRPFYGWLIPFPDLEGTWRGTVVSTWRNPETGQAPPPIEAMLVIRQKFDSISCTLFTAESESQSNAAALQLEEGSDRKITQFPSHMDDRRAAAPICAPLPGWDQEITTARQMSELPDDALRYLKRLSEVVGRPVEMVSVGPDREQTILAGGSAL